MGKYTKLTLRLEALTGVQRFRTIGSLWPRLSATMQISLVALILTVLGEVNSADLLHRSMVELSYEALHPAAENDESPDHADTLEE